MTSPNSTDDDDRDLDALRARAMERLVPTSQHGPKLLAAVATMVERTRERGLLAR